MATRHPASWIRRNRFAATIVLLALAAGIAAAVTAETDARSPVEDQGFESRAFGETSPVPAVA